MAKQLIGTIAGLEVWVNGDSPFHVHIKEAEKSNQRMGTGIALDPAEGIVLAEFLLTASRTPIKIGEQRIDANTPERTRQLYKLVEESKRGEVL